MKGKRRRENEQWRVTDDEEVRWEIMVIRREGKLEGNNEKYVNESE